MDQSHANQYNAANAQNNGPANYAYNQNQNDPFQSFIHTEDDGAFDNSWQTPEFSTHQPANNIEYEQTTQPWHQASYQAPDSNYLLAQYNVDPRYSTTGSNFQYPSYDPRTSQDFSARSNAQPTPYHEGSGFNSDALSHGPPYQYPRPQETEQTSQTISPAAITSYPDLSESSFNSKSIVRGTIEVVNLSFANIRRLINHRKLLAVQAICLMEVIKGL